MRTHITDNFAKMIAVFLVGTAAAGLDAIKPNSFLYYTRADLVLIFYLLQNAAPNQIIIIRLCAMMLCCLYIDGHMMCIINFIYAEDAIEEQSSKQQMAAKWLQKSIYICGAVHSSALEHGKHVFHNFILYCMYIAYTIYIQCAFFHQMRVPIF